MKRSFVFISAFAMSLFLLNSFVLKEKGVKNTPLKEGASTAVANIIFKSADGGQTWQDISEGLPEKMQREGVWSDGIVVNEHELYLRAANGVYHNEPTSKAPFWSKENFPGKQRNITPTRDGILAYTIRGQFLKKTNGVNKWSPVYSNFQEQAVSIDKTVDWMYKNYKEREVRSVLETKAGTVFIASNNMLFRSTDKGKTWKQVHVGDGRMKLTESNGVILSTSIKGILRSADDGQTWDRVIDEGGVGVAVERIDGGFAAIVNNPISKRNNIHLSLDNGKTWSTIGEKLQPTWSSLLMIKLGILDAADVLCIKQMGKYLICGRADGIFRSADMGKTWENLALPDVKNYGFRLSVSGNTMYIMPNKGC